MIAVTTIRPAERKTVTLVQYKQWRKKHYDSYIWCIGEASNTLALESIICR